MIDDSSVYKRIVDLLDDSQVSYQFFIHEPVYTSKQAAEVRGTDNYMGAKAIIFKADRKPILS